LIAAHQSGPRLETVESAPLAGARTRRELLERDFNLSVAARRCFADNSGYSVEMHPHYTPCRIAQHDYSDLPAFQILLVPNSLVGR
jgi:hypothetical protein